MKKLFMIVLFCVLSQFSIQSNQTTMQFQFKIQDIVLKQEITEWEIFKQALMFVESRGNECAVGKTDDVGILQITPIYVKECNRLSKNKQWELSDRVDKNKSLEMFEF